MKNLKLIFLVTALIFVNACTSSNTRKGERALASSNQEKITLDKLDVPIDIYLNTEYRGSFVADASDKDCTGSISIWFYKDSKGKIMYYSSGQKADSADCKLFILGDLADKSQNGMDACTGEKFDRDNVDTRNIHYLREINFDKMRIVAPSCETPMPANDGTIEYSDKLKLKKFKSNGANGTIHLQISLQLVPVVTKEKKMNYYLTPIF